MATSKRKKNPPFFVTRRFLFGAGVFGVTVFAGSSVLDMGKVTYERVNGERTSDEEVLPNVPRYKSIDPEWYEDQMFSLSNLPPIPVVYDPETGEEIPPAPREPSLWPVTPFVYPNPGAVLPEHRIIAYYGNLYSTRMGALGEYPEEEMKARLLAEVERWTEADPETPAIPALHYIVTTAQLDPGADGKHRLRMPSSQIDEVLRMAESIGALVFLDIQVGLSTIEEELPLLEKYLALPHVHLGIDPEFSMKSRSRPGTEVGTFDAKDMNFAIAYLSRLVEEHALPPKVLVIHRYTVPMLTNSASIQPTPDVQVVIHMDGWGGQAKKKTTYEMVVVREPVQFAGFKIFYKHDIRDPGTVLFAPGDLLKLSPRPSYIQYQ